ncbi:hypothetical protein CH63R_03026 [Colletotrichum higginsianum IMI 349063]|uniref:Uncharacterized protein n=1 Tax=Colletotrichum higginsianum (strain IMI 349063) TaxID=759273 RepID=A0A1B7YQI2_COLHI|nr:hypothetical protein CH63R_03026 [Colletotrichum higginsianum IMI 349063]OBR14300.1 hypothetical protein CH63R_03026 [Colletotrichum higginsianum IMI 349063]
MDCLVGGALCLPGKNPPSPDAPANFHSGKITGHRRSVSRRVRNGWRESRGAATGTSFQTLLTLAASSTAAVKWEGCGPPAFRHSPVARGDATAEVQLTGRAGHAMPAHKGCGGRSQRPGNRNAGADEDVDEDADAPRFR